MRVLKSLVPSSISCEGCLDACSLVAGEIVSVQTFEEQHAHERFADPGVARANIRNDQFAREVEHLAGHPDAIAAGTLSHERVEFRRDLRGRVVHAST